MMMTVRMNRAKGTHVAYRMSHIVHRLLDEFMLDPQQIATEMGMTKDEVDLLYQEDVFKQKDTAHHVYSKSWIPAERPGAKS